MGKKGKARQDKFYHLAKETGYRSRAAFKLLQLNRKFEFLEKSRVVIDLCAAPGSWMQVAKQHMPVSSLIIGIDLFPIKPIQGCLALQEDITTEKCYQNLKKELASWKADVVLHDGAPNVGQNWIYDAFIQNQLVLSALKLASEFLNKGGWFVTKIFRSKDYNALMWVLRQLFKRVHSTKPHASRMESAEIFVICQGYKAPDKLDPKFLDPKYVFQEVEADSTTVKGLQAHEKSKPRAGGYEEGITSLHKAALISDFVHKENFVDILNNATVLEMNDEEIANHPLTTEEIKECCKDIKVLGRKDLKALLGWRKAIQKDLDEQHSKLEEEDMEPSEVDIPLEDDDDSDDEDLSQVDRQVKEMEAARLKEAKRKKKKILKERKTLQEKMKLKMVIAGDSGPGLQEQVPLFNLTQIKSDQDLDRLADQEADELVEETSGKRAPLPKKAKYDKDSFQLDSKGRYRREEDSDEELIFDSDDEYDSDVAQDTLGLEDSSIENDEGDEKKSKKVRFAEAIKAAKKEVEIDDRKHPLLTDLDDADSSEKRKRKAEKWFMKSAFQDIEDDADEDIELDNMARQYSLKGKKPSADDDNFTDDEDESDGEDDDENKNIQTGKRQSTNSDGESDENTSSESEDSDSEDMEEEEEIDSVAPAAAGQVRGKKRSLTAEALALGSLIIKSRKAKRDISDDGWNRYAFNDENLPDWFVEDERRHSHKELPVTKELVQQYRDRMKEINVRPIKKVVEAKARKKRRSIRRLEKARKKADTISETMGISDYDKAQQIRHIHKKAKQEKKKEVTYVVAKKHQAGKKAHRPAGVKGQFKVVDRRMKKDDKKRKAVERRKGKKARTPKK